MLFPAAPPRQPQACAIPDLVGLCGCVMCSLGCLEATWSATSTCTCSRWVETSTPALHGPHGSASLDSQGCSRARPGCALLTRLCGCVCLALCACLQVQACPKR